MGVYVCSKGNPIRLTLSSIPNSQLVFIKYTPANKGKGKHSSGSLVSAKKKKKKERNQKRWNLEEGAQPLLVMLHCSCAIVPVSLEAWTLIPQIIGETEFMWRLH